ncbi:MAG: hypothetical protein ACRCUY_01575, partial [Thermoguttaceae bacterium]
MFRLLTTSGSFFLILALYFVYGWVAVPMILPNNTDGEKNWPVPNDAEIHGEIAPMLFLFSEDSWERDSNSQLHLLQLGSTVVLFREDTIEGNVAKLSPCTILFLSSDPELSDAEKYRQAIILRTSDHARLEFSGELNLSKFPLPQMQGGTLVGPVTISSDMSSPDSEDDFFMASENVTFSETPALTTISTLKDVVFRFGQHSGEGTNLLVNLTPSNPKDLKSAKELGRMKLETLRFLNLAFPDQGNINIVCQREFQFVANPPEQNWIASFHGKVEAVRTNLQGEKDVLNAEELRVSFRQKEMAVTTPQQTQVKSTSSMNSLEPIMFIAVGKRRLQEQAPIPARIKTMQNGGAILVGDQILYDIKQNFVTIESAKDASGTPQVDVL